MPYPARTTPGNIWMENRQRTSDAGGFLRCQAGNQGFLQEHGDENTRCTDVTAFGGNSVEAYWAARGWSVTIAPKKT